MTSIPSQMCWVTSRRCRWGTSSAHAHRLPGGASTTRPAATDRSPPTCPPAWPRSWPTLRSRGASRAGRRGDRSRMAGQAQLVSGRHRGPDDPATGAAGPILGLSTQAASDCSPRQIRSRTRMHSIRHHPASVRTQIRHFGRDATGHGSDQDAAHGGYIASSS